MQKILVVDDSESMRGVIRFFLQSAGYIVEEATNGSDGLAMVKVNHYDVIITDIHMPKMDGYQFISQARKYSRNKQVPILTLTTEKSADGVQKGKEAGANGWLVKPFDDRTLLNLIRKVAA